MGKTSQLNDTQKVLATTQNELTSTQSDLAGTEASLSNTETELATTQRTLTSTKNDLATTRNQLQTTSKELQDTSVQLTQAQTDYATTLKALNTEKESYTQVQNSLDNLQVNYDRLTSGYGYVLRDPTYQEVKAFIAADTTNSNAYVNDTYVCEDFSKDVKTHAMQHKFRCAYVSIRFYDGNGAHAIVAFNTTDRGIIYIEPQSDEEVNLRAGYHYWTQCVIAAARPLLH